MEFQSEISGALATGEKTLDEIKQLLPEKRRSKVLDYLRAGKDAGLLTYITKKVDGKYVVLVRPGPAIVGLSTPPVARRVTPTSKPQSGDAS